MAPDEALRLDKWLWFARFCKSRTQASALCAAGRLRLDGTVIHRAHQAVRAGAEIIMLDNMPVAEMKKAVQWIEGRALVEASGGGTLENVRGNSATGGDWIFVGALTQ